MNIEEIYQAEQELERYNVIMSFTEILTQEEYDFCKVYSEANKEEYDLKREMGI